MTATPQGSASISEDFWRVARSVRRLGGQALTPWDLAHHQWRALRTIADHGPLRLSELAAYLKITPRAVTDVVEGLAERELISREHDPGDKRAVQVELTARGRQVVGEISSSRDTLTDAYFDRLSPEDRRELTRLLRVLEPGE